MRKGNANKWVGMVLMLGVLAVMSAGCLTDSKDKSGSSMPTYEGFGSWPEYAGNWGSITGAAGSKHSTWAYLEVVLGEDGTFSGTYRRYGYSYTYNMSTAWGTYPVDVYNPAGNAKTTRGAVNFGAKTGVMTFEGIGETTFTLSVISGKEIAFLFPSGFGFTVANIQR